MVIVTLIKRLTKTIARTDTRLLLLVTLLVIVTGTVGTYLAESAVNSQFQNFGDTLWWVVVTMSTVGYGDKIPITTAGRIIGSICMIAGPILMVSLASSIGFSIYNKWTKGIKGMAQVKTKGHIVICGWNANAIDIINELRVSKLRDRPITIIDDKIDAKPIDDSRVSFVRGNASEVGVLNRANIREAKYAIVLAGDNTPVADQKTVLTVLAIKTENPEVISCVELNDANNEGHVRRAGCNIVVNASDLASRLVAMSLQNPAINTVIRKLVSQAGNEIYRVIVPDQYVGYSFADTLHDLKQKYDIITIGIERDGECLINPSSSLPLKITDYLLVISEEMPSF